MKTILISGASRGIGRGIALALKDRNYHFVITCKEHEELLNEVKEELERCGRTCTTFVGDLSDHKTIIKFFKYLEYLQIRVDILVNNVGISHIGLLQDMKTTQWNNIVSTNLTTVFSLCKRVIPMMLHNGGGKIINISSVWGLVGASCEVAYSTTKGGINAFTKALAKEVAPSNIQVNAIACGLIDTEMNDFLSEEDKETLFEEIPAGRMGTAEEVGEFVTRLIDSPDYLTGQVIALDGGWI